jgi:16S rRNA (guanine527-N7)-methyltransferase
MTSLSADALHSALHLVGDQLGVPLDDRALTRLLDYLALLQRWNATYNLTAVRDPEAMLTQHLADCLAVIPSLQRVSQPGSRRLLDVGSGGGLPGVVVAVACPQWQVTCVDTVGKKAAFVRQVAAELGLGNLHAAHARVETLQLPPFDVIASRAFASLPDFVRLTWPLLAGEGAWMAMKGKTPDEEIAAVADRVDVFHVEQLTVPGLGAERCVVWMRPLPAKG